MSAVERTQSPTIAGVGTVGRIERENAGVVKYIWYPGELKDWKKAGVSVGAGLGAGLLAGILTQSVLIGVIVGASLTAGMSGYSFGQKDAKALVHFGSLKTAETPRALWRALVKGFGTTLAAVLVVHAAESGIASWLLPMVPAIVAALAHQFGMAHVRLAEEKAAQKEAKKEEERELLRQALEARDRKAAAAAKGVEATDDESVAAIKPTTIEIAPSQRPEAPEPTTQSDPIAA